MNNQSLTNEALSAQLDEIRHIESLDELLSKVKKLDALKVALEAVDTFHDQSIKYARLEVAALLRVVELGGLTSLRGPHRRTAEWLQGLEPDEREEMIAKCSDGMTIDKVYRVEYANPAKVNESIMAAKKLIFRHVEEVTRNGITDISETTEKINEQVKDRFVAGSLTDGLRNALRRQKAVCVEEGTGIYVIPGRASKDEIRSAVLLRYKSIVRDFERIEAICKTANTTLRFKDFKPEDGWYLTNNPYYGHLVFALYSVGAIAKEDEQDMFDYVEATDFRKEMEYCHKQLQFSRDALIEAEYKNLEKRRTEAAAS